MSEGAPLAEASAGCGSGGPVSSCAPAAAGGLPPLAQTQTGGAGDAPPATGSSSTADCSGDGPIRDPRLPYSPGSTELHHSFPTFLGGPEKQDLTTLSRDEHNDLHRLLRDFLANCTDDQGNNMGPRRGNDTSTIQANFTPAQRLDAARQFYRGPGSSFATAAADFFRQFGSG